MKDVIWLGLFNESRRAEKLNPLSPNSFEYVIDRLEKEAFASSFVVKQLSSTPSGRRLSVAEPCAVCLGVDSQPSNAIVSCDSCSMTVHQVQIFIFSSCVLLENITDRNFSKYPSR